MESTVSFASTMSSATSASVDSLLPLSLLEAVRDVDSPIEDFEAELVGDLRNKRLGLSDTVYMQIKRYTEAVKRSQRTAHDETVALAKLIGRRTDAEAVFRAAGKFLARESYSTISPLSRRLMLTLPSLFTRPMALRHTRKLARRYLGGRVSRVGTSIYLEVAHSVTQDAASRSIGCSYYEAGLKELLRLLVNSVGAVEHHRCATRGEGTCSWRAEWRVSHTPSE